MSDSDSSESQSKISNILKKAMTIGSGVYLLGEESLQKTLSTVQMPKEWFRDAIENVFDAYTVTVNAEIKLTPKKRKEKEEEIK